jgi:HAD superfamily hydrolase (TIGR01484 family)
MTELEKIPQLVVFDLDGTLAESRSDITDDMAKQLCVLLSCTKVAILSGGAIEQLEHQFASHLRCRELFNNLHLYPTSGASSYSFVNSQWKKQHEELLSIDEREEIISRIQELKRDHPLVQEIVIDGMDTEDRGTQISYSALGIDAARGRKKAWDPDGGIRNELINFLKMRSPQFEYRSGGTTTIDITKRGVDKKFGIRKMSESLNIGLADMLYVGDAIYPGGNDYAAKEMGLTFFNVEGPEETLQIIKDMIKLCR